MTQELSATLGHSHAQTPDTSFSPSHSDGSLSTNLLMPSSSSLTGVKLPIDDQAHDVDSQMYGQDGRPQEELDSTPWQSGLQRMDSTLYDGQHSHPHQRHNQLKAINSISEGLSPSLSTECSSPSTPNEGANLLSEPQLGSTRGKMGKAVSMPPLRVTSSGASLPPETRHSEGHERNGRLSHIDIATDGPPLLGLQLDAGPSQVLRATPLSLEPRPQLPVSSPTGSLHSSLAAPERHSVSTSIPSVTVIPTSPGPRTSFTERTPSSQFDNTFLEVGAIPSDSIPNSISRSTPSLADRHHGRRRVAEHRGGNRLSGFFQHLLHLRDRDHQTSSNSVTHESEPQNLEENPQIETPVAPPPPLPPPSLNELGLNMTSITPHLAPSQFPNPPTSGVFLAPHYLLLCHGQGLDVLPLVSPPVQQPYALVRRVAFKAVLVMEQRSVMIAIAGRREGVRVYALEEVRKAVEWRVEVEIEREKEKAAKDRGHKRNTAMFLDERITEPKTLNGHTEHAKPPGECLNHNGALLGEMEIPQPVSPPPLYSSLTHTGRRLTTRISTSSISTPQISPVRERGASNSTVIRSSMATETRDIREKRRWMESRESDDEALDPVAAGQLGSAALDERTSALNNSMPSGRSMSTLAGPGSNHYPNLSRRSRPGNPDHSPNGTMETIAGQPASPSPTLMSLRQALGNNTITLTPRPPRASTSMDDAPDTPLEGTDVITFAQALVESRLPSAPPPTTPVIPSSAQPRSNGHRPNFVSSRRNMHGYATDTSQPDSPLTDFPNPRARVTRPNASSDRRRRRRWSVLDTMFKQSGASSRSNPLIPTSVSSTNIPATATPDSLSGDEAVLRRTSRSLTSPVTAHSIGRASSASIPTSLSGALASEPRPRPPVTRTIDRIFQPQIDPDAPAASPIVTSSVQIPTPRRNPLLPRLLPAPRARFLPRWLGALSSSTVQPSHEPNRFHEASPSVKLPDDQDRRLDLPAPSIAHAPAPKLEYVKLPGTKGALAIKAVETPRKSFLAILCGEAGEKVELFAGTYRTALGLSRTFILPDSPRSLELQLQGDDLVELFLVFGQNVFGLEPATVRVREVRIGRAERRAARRRAREARAISAAADAATSLDDVAPAETVVTTVVSVGDDPSDSLRDNMSGRRSASIARPRRSVAGYVTSSGVNGSSLASAELERGRDRGRDNLRDGSATPTTPNTAAELIQAPEELAALAAVAQLGPYTTFQQLSFAPAFPLGTIADDYIIPPTYDDFLDYRSQNEPQATPVPDLLTAPDAPPLLEPLNENELQLSPDTVTKWFYIDPKGVLRGPWKASLMQSWYEDGFLPPDLPVRRDTELEYTLLRDLCSNTPDPEHPFVDHGGAQPTIGTVWSKPRVLLNPTSLLVQPKHFGPPALFFCSRGGHSTTIVDSRGRSVLRGRLNWTADDHNGKLGDIKRLEAFDTGSRTVVAAIRQGGVEVADVGDALLCPADRSRSYLPHFNATPDGISRRSVYTWRLGATIGPSDLSNLAELPPPKTSASKRFASLTLKSGQSQTSVARASPKVDSVSASDGDTSLAEDVLWLGRNQNTIYLCERTVSSFRILSLSTTS